MQDCKFSMRVSDIAITITYHLLEGASGAKWEHDRIGCKQIVIHELEPQGSHQTGGAFELWGGVHWY
jgi:hypothetical protein